MFKEEMLALNQEKIQKIIKFYLTINLFNFVVVRDCIIKYFDLHFKVMTILEDPN